jgi:Protein of unknown function (DUF4242)
MTRAWQGAHGCGVDRGERHRGDIEEARSMPKYVIERTVPGLGRMTADELSGLSAASNDVLASMDGDIQWVQSYATEDRLFCVYNADGPERIREHARRGGFPCDRISQVGAIIDPVTGERDGADR